MTLPATIKVGYRDFRVEEWLPRAAEASCKYGECDRHNGIIRLRTDLQEQVIGQVLLHEIIHAAFGMGDLNTPDEEKVVTVLAVQLAQIIRDNPETIEFISRALRPTPGD